MLEEVQNKGEQPTLKVFNLDRFKDVALVASHNSTRKEHRCKALEL